MSDNGEYEYDYGDGEYGEYDYGEAYGDDGAPHGDAAYEIEETWETKTDNAYAIAKGNMDSEPFASEEAFLKILAEDPDKGVWSFKAHKMLCRLYQRQRMWDKLLPAYTKLLSWSHGGMTKMQKEKAVNKFLDRCASNVTSSTMLTLYEATIRVLGEGFESIWFRCRFGMAQILLSDKEPEAAERSLRRLVEWGTTGTADALIRKGPQLMEVYALLLQLYMGSERLDKVQELYAKASTNETLVSASGVVRAAITESGAQMYMHQGEWERAYQLYLEAFHKYDECGDGRRIRSLKALVVAAMLAKGVSSHVINPFASPEAAAYRNDNEIIAISALIDAAERKDAARFAAVLADPQNRRAIYGDKEFYKYLEPVILAFRMDKLRAVCAPFTQVKLSYVAKEMNITEEEAEQMCVTGILEGSIDAYIDQPARTLLLPEQLSADVDRMAALNEWSRQMCFRFSSFSEGVSRFVN